MKKHKIKVIYGIGIVVIALAFNFLFRYYVDSNKPIPLEAKINVKLSSTTNKKIVNLKDSVDISEYDSTIKKYFNSQEEVDKFKEKGFFAIAEINLNGTLTDSKKFISTLIPMMIFTDGDNILVLNQSDAISSYYFTIIENNKRSSNKEYLIYVINSDSSQMMFSVIDPIQVTFKVALYDYIDNGITYIVNNVTYKENLTTYIQFLN